MAGAFALTCLGKIGDVVLGKIGDCFVAPIQRQFTYMCCFNSNITELETQLKNLETTRQGVQLGVDDTHRNVRIVAPNVETWLTSANGVTTEVEGIIKDKAKVKEGCLNGWCPNLKLRYSLSRKAVKKTKVVVDLQVKGVQYLKVSYPPAPACLETHPNIDFTGFESRRLNIEQIVKPLTNDDTNLVGICGLPGVGKTTMAKQIEKRAIEDRLFAEVAFVTVGQYPVLTYVQNCIAEIFGLSDLKSHVDPTTRATMLRRRLLQDKKKLLILDDIWSEFKLEDYGIPLEGSQGIFKILYTSRSRDLWHDVPTKKQIDLEPLSEEEAWQLFKQKAGNLVDSPDLQPLAKKIVNECGCLPLLLVIIGSILSKKSKGNRIKDIWEDMLFKLSNPSSRVDMDLSSRLELSYNYIEDEEAKRLFLLCCLLEEDKDIPLEDLARYACGLSLFDEVYEMSRVRHRVCALVDDLKSRYLLLDSKSIYGKECVKVHDVVRDMGISIASRDKAALVSHGAVFEWPRKDTYEHYNSISVISEKITELPEGLTFGNLKFLLLGCSKLQKLPCNFFEQMEKLKVLELKNFHGILTFQPWKNLTMLALENFRGKLDNVGVIGDLLNLEILSYRNSEIKELPEEIRRLVNLRLLDLSRTDSLERIPPGVLACLVRLEELYVVHSNFEDWEGEGQKEGRNANLKEFESLPYLNTLEIMIKKHVVVPKLSILGKLKKYKVIQEGLWKYIACGEDSSYERQLMIMEWNWDTPAGRGGIDTLLMSSDCLFLREGNNDLVVQLLLPNGVDSLQQLKYLEIEDCDTLECLANTINPVQPPPNATAVFPILEELRLYEVRNLREVCRNPVPVGSFRQLTKIRIRGCDGLGNLFQQSIVGCLTELKCLIIWDCDKMEEVFIWEEQRKGVHVAPNRIEFPKLERLELENLPSLVGFCRGIDQIDLPQLKKLELQDLRKVNCVFPSNNNLSSNSKQNDSFLSLFPKKVSLPNLEVLRVDKLENLERLGHGPLSVGSLFKLGDFSVCDCGKLLCVFPSELVLMLRNLEELTVKRCNLLEVVFELEGVDSNEPNPELLSPLKVVKLCDLPKLNYISKRDPMGLKYIQTLEIKGCDSLRYVFAPTVTKSIPQLRELKIQRCKTLSRIVAEENGLGDSSADGVEFPQLESLDLCELPNLVSFFPNVNATLAKSTDQLHNTMRPQPLFNNKVAFPRLEKLYLEGLPNLSDLWCSEVSLPNLEVLKVSKLENLERLGPLLVGTLFKLRRFSVRDCGKLHCVFPSQLAPRLRNVEELTVERCNLLEVVFELEGVDCNEPNPELISPLKVVKLRDLPILNYISKRDPMGFKYIQTLKIEGCDSLRYVFAPTVTKGIPQLRELKIQRCKTLSKIVAEENGLGDSSVDGVEFPQLESLDLCELPNLVSFFPDVNANLAKSTDQLHNTMRPQPLFNKKVVIPSLKYLKLLGLENVSDLWCSKLQRSSFSKLEKLEVSNCASLRNMFHPSMAKCLVNLKKLLIEDCSTLEAVVGKEEVGGHERKIHKVEFHQLESLDLRDVPNLVSLFPNVNIGLPESADYFHNPMQPQSLFNEKVAIPSLKYLQLLGLKYVSDLWCSKLPSSSFSKLEKLTVGDCASLRNIFHPSMAEGLVNVKELVIEDCSTLEVVVGKEEEVEGGHGIKIDKTLFPQLGKLHLRSLPNLRMFCHFAYPLELPLLSEMAILFCPSMDVFSLGHMSTPNLSLSSLRGYGDLINAKQLLRENGDDPMATSMEKPRTLDYVTDKSKSREVAETQCRLVAMPKRIDGAHKVARLLYTNSGDGVLALGCNGSMRLWKWGRSKENPTGKATATVVPQQWKPASGLAMTNDVTGAKLEEAVPCIALSEYDSYVISACGGVISLFHMMTFEVWEKFKPPPPASTFLSFDPQDNRVIAIGMEDSTIHIYRLWLNEVISILEGHQKRITGLAFSTNLNILVSSGADAQLCIWSIGTWKKLKSVPIQLAAGKARNDDIRVQFHSNQIGLLVSHETQLAIYDPSRDRICQCVSQDVLPAPISFAAYSCDCKLVYTSFCNGNIGVFDAESLTLRCYIAPSVYLSPAMLSGSQAVYPLVVAAHPQLPNQFAIGLTDGSVIVMELPTITGEDGGTATSSNASNQTSVQEEEDVDVDEDALITTRTRTSTTSTHDDMEDLEEKRKKEEEKEKKGKAPISG